MDTLLRRRVRNHAAAHPHCTRALPSASPTSPFPTAAAPTSPSLSPHVSPSSREARHLSLLCRSLRCSCSHACVASYSMHWTHAVESVCRCACWRPFAFAQRAAPRERASWVAAVRLDAHWLACNVTPANGRRAARGHRLLPDGRGLFPRVRCNCRRVHVRVLLRRRRLAHLRLPFLCAVGVPRRLLRNRRGPRRAASPHRRHRRTVAARYPAALATRSAPAATRAVAAAVTAVEPDAAAATQATPATATARAERAAVAAADAAVRLVPFELPAGPQHLDDHARRLLALRRQCLCVQAQL
jgi:hypothetical protein